MSSLPDLTPSLLAAWQNRYQDLSLPFVVCQQGSPEVVLGMLQRGWITDVNERSPEGIPLAGYLYIRSPKYTKGLEPDTLPSLDEPSGHGYGPRQINDFGPVVTALVRAGADPWICWEGAQSGLHSRNEGLTANAGPLSLLHCAIAKADAGMVQWLLAHPHCPSAGELSALTVEKDLARFCNISGRFLGHIVSNEIQAGLLHLAVNSASDSAPAIVGMLIDAGLDPNASDSDGRTPLFYVRRRDVLDLLLEKGADPSSTSGALFDFWRSHLETSQNLAEFQAPVLTHMAKSQNPDELRKINEPALINVLMTGNKTNVQSLVRKAKFGYDYKIKLRDGGQWNLVSPILLRVDINDKVDPLLHWLGERVNWREDLGGGATNLGLSLLRSSSWHWARHYHEKAFPVSELMELLDPALDRAMHWMPRASLYSVLSTVLSLAISPALEKVKANQKYQGVTAAGRPISLHYSLNSTSVWEQAKKLTEDPGTFASEFGGSNRLAKVARAVVDAQTKYWIGLEKQGKPLDRISSSEMGLVLTRLSMLMAEASGPAAQQSYVYLSLLASSFSSGSSSYVWGAHQQVAGEPVRAINSTELMGQLASHLDTIDTSTWKDEDLEFMQVFCQKSPSDLSGIEAWVRQQRLSRLSRPATSEGRRSAPRM